MELKNRLEEIVKRLKSVDGVDGEVVDELVSIKGQLDVEPTRIYVAEKDVVKEYDMGAFRFVRCKSCIIFQDKGGMCLVVNPRMTALYEHLDNLLNMKDSYDTLSDELKEAYNTMLSATVYVLNLPIYATCDDEFFFGIAGDIIKRLDVMVDKIQKQELQEETHKENAEFENKQEAFEETLKEE